MYIYAPKKYRDPPYHRVVHTNPSTKRRLRRMMTWMILCWFGILGGILAIHHGEAKVWVKIPTFGRGM